MLTQAQISNGLGLCALACVAIVAYQWIKENWPAIAAKVAENKGGVVIPPRPGSQVDNAAQLPGKYLAVQKMLLDARAACGDCPEAVFAIDSAIKATVAMVVGPKPEPKQPEGASEK